MNDKNPAVQPPVSPPTSEQIALDLLAKMWQAYAEQQCGWQDAACYHGHTACSKQGVGAAGLVFEEHLGPLATLMSAPIPEHFESKQEADRD